MPPVRDEEHEIQRKAHAKRVRETRRSTQVTRPVTNVENSHALNCLQGVTLEDLKSAEQLVKKKQQQENAQRTTELQQLAGSPTPQQQVGSTATPPGTPPPPPSHPSNTATTTTLTASATLVTGPAGAAAPTPEPDRQERRPSWRLRIETNDKSRVSKVRKAISADVDETKTADGAHRCPSVVFLPVFDIVTVVWCGVQCEGRRDERHSVKCVRLIPRPCVAVLAGGREGAAEQPGPPPRPAPRPPPRPALPGPPRHQARPRQRQRAAAQRPPAALRR